MPIEKAIVTIILWSEPYSTANQLKKKEKKGPCVRELFERDMLGEKRFFFFWPYLPR
jgi:hypothetical protein